MNTGTREELYVIGPVFPYRGGIALHTTMLVRALREHCELRVLSFRRQYPSLLYPGKVDRDAAPMDAPEQDVSYELDPLQPWTWFRAARRILNSKSSGVLIPWWTIFWFPCIGFIAWMLRRNGKHVVFFCHNVTEHETTKWKKWLTSKILPLGEGFFVQSTECASELVAMVPNADVRVHPHPLDSYLPAVKQSLPRRAEVELLFYGYVRPYKGLDDLIEALGKSGQPPEKCFLTIAGEFWEGLDRTREKIQVLELEKSVELRPWYHSDQDTADLFARADLVVLPYRSATGSAVLAMAYHYETPVAATRTGGLSEVVSDGETGFLFPSGDTEALAHLLKNVTKEECTAMHAGIRKVKQRLSWNHLALEVLRMFQMEAG